MRCFNSFVAALVKVTAKTLSGWDKVSSRRARRMMCSIVNVFPVPAEASKKKLPLDRGERIKDIKSFHVDLGEIGFLSVHVHLDLGALGGCRDDGNSKRERILESGHLPL